MFVTSLTKITKDLENDRDMLSRYLWICIIFNICFKSNVMTLAESLRPGDLVAIVSPAGIVDASYIKAAAEYLRGRGLRIRIGDHVYDSWNRFAGTDRNRAEDLQAAINNPEVAAIWFSRGGYGCGRLTGMVDLSPLAKKHKWFIGCSDITYFHSLLQNTMGLTSVHGPMPKAFDRKGVPDNGVDMLWDLVSGLWPEYMVEPHPLNKAGIGEGVLIGGNLTVLDILKGSILDFNPEGKILFIEDVGEYLYHMDRLVRGFKLAGKFEGLTGLIIGGMTDMKDSEPHFGQTAYEIIAEAVRDLPFPVAFGFPAGHDLLNLPLVLGTEVRMKVTSEGLLLQYNT